MTSFSSRRSLILTLYGLVFTDDLCLSYASVLLHVRHFFCDHSMEQKALINEVFQQLINLTTFCRFTLTQPLMLACFVLSSSITLSVVFIAMLNFL